MAEKNKSQQTTAKPGLHPQNPFNAPYDFEKLQAVRSALKPFVIKNPRGIPTIDFANPQAVLELNRALLALQYGITSWSIPTGYLCPPIPGRADYIHHIHDLPGIAGRSARVLEIGTGASCIYPIIGACTYGWSFTATDIDPDALNNAWLIAQTNKTLAGLIDLRLQTDPTRIFLGVIRDGESYDLVMCNPPFHSSAEKAAAGTKRKLANLGKGKPDPKEAIPLNFGGQANELIYPGGDAAFIHKMLDGSRLYRSQVRWFTCLVSKADLLPSLKKGLKVLGAADVRVLEMHQGQKTSRILAWTYQKVVS